MNLYFLGIYCHKYLLSHKRDGKVSFFITSFQAEEIIEKIPSQVNG